ncbi:DUF4037 domain-containing protein [Kutzneria sp. CA-103260]|uniref:DUF4037 domain-containing protein n=1 Tax=Kutzneria sp. CA-103260 TaxID=2802641 RepID=UPI001BAB7BEE|nr:DUF4037 domain-containing protein [Kutzneria sp. CA-103260]QUQ67334.1 hypothetical protein JJ691_50680 [Kutzneria sp. CA-103260]
MTGLKESREHYESELAPKLQGIPHAAARIGHGSEVVGFDTDRSRDHDWGPFVQIFVPDPDSVPVQAFRPGEWLRGHLGFDPLAGITTFDWLATSSQGFAEVTAGAVFHDDIGDLTRARSALAWYPDDIWRYLLACQWKRLSQEEAFVGRTREVGDELGSAVLAARLVRDVMRLCFLMARRYAPYGKWFGSAFAQLPCAATLTPMLHGALGSDREEHLAAAYRFVAGWHNELGLTDPIDPATRPYHTRPYQVLHAERFAEALLDTVADAEIRRLPWYGNVDQAFDSTDALADRDRCRALFRR